MSLMPAIMRKLASTSICCPLIAGVLLASCSPGADVAERPSDEVRAFSEEDKRVASALSVSNRQEILNSESPYARALLCGHAMNALAGTFLEARGLSGEQRQAMVQAQAYFDEQLRVLAQREGKSASDLSEDLEKMAEERADRGESAQIAVACLRDLQRNN